MRCPVCQQPAPDLVMALDGVPALCNVLCGSVAEARGVPRGRIELRTCGACGLVFNGRFDPGLVRYSGTYENALHFSATFRDYERALARDLASRHGLEGVAGERAGGHIVEVGCGDGHFLEVLCGDMGARGTGFDPAFDAGRAGAAPASGVCLHAAAFRPESAEPADLMVCRHVLEHIPGPVEFLRELSAGLRDGGILYVEVPRGEWVAGFDGDKGSGWDVIYEHCNYFTAGSLAAALGLAGLELLRVSSRYGGQFLSAEARRWSRPSGIRTAEGARGAEDWRRFAAGHQQRLEEWSGRLRMWRRGGKHPILWGAGSKGVMFLNTVPGAGEAVWAVVDVNPRKHGRFVAGVGIPVVAPESLADGGAGGRGTRTVILANPIYREEVGGMLRGLGVEPEVAAL
jgi:SAM-dependent methyltransferase